MQYRFLIAIILAILAVAFAHQHRTGCGNHNCNNNGPCREAENNTAVNNPTLCNGFFLCLDGTAIPGTCPPGQWFNPDTLHCDSNDADCPEDEDFECPSDEGVYFLASSESCDEYILCFGGFPIIRSCAKGLHFDPRNGFCTLPERAECKLNICPPDNDPNNLVFIPSEVDCELYYICFDGETIPQRCAPDFHWDVVYEVCNFPEIANCTANETDSTPEPFPEPHEVECPKDGIHFIPHPKSCGHYFICTNGESRLLPCADNLLFDPENEWCDFEENVVCDLDTSSEEEPETTPRPIPEPHEIDCPSGDGFFCIKHPKSCEFFFICKNGVSSLVPCAYGHFFDPILQWCDKKDNVRCHLDYSSEEDIEPGPPPPTTEPGPEPHETDCPSDDGFYIVEHPKSCEYFFFCVDGVSILRPCAPGSLFDPILQWCDIPENVECPHNGNSSSEDSSDSSSGDDSGSTSGSKDSSESSSGDDSGSTSGSKDSSDSSSGDDSGSTSGSKDSSESSSGDDSSDGSSEETTPRPIPKPHEIDCPPEDGFFCIKHPKSCEFFFICKNGVSTLVPCAYGHFFDPIRQWCDKKDNVRCHLDHSSEEDIIPGPPPPTTEPGPEPHETDCPSDDGFYIVEHPKSCEYFFFCVDGVSILRPCAPGSLFDPILQWCDIPENVDCPHNGNSSSEDSSDSSSGDDSGSTSGSKDSSESSSGDDSGSTSGSKDSSDSSSGDDSGSKDSSDSSSGDDSGSTSGSKDSSESSSGDDSSKGSKDSSDSSSGDDSGSTSGSKDSSESSSGDDSSDGSSEETTPRPIPKPHEIDCPSEDGFFCIKHPKSCEFFFICKNGVSTLVPCAYGHFFDPIRQWCDKKDNVRCHLDHSSEEDIIPGPPPPTTEPGPEPHETDCPSDDGFYIVEHPKSCEYFFFCVDGVSILRPCAPGSIFDPILKWCDIPENVDCPHNGNSSSENSGSNESGGDTGENSTPDESGDDSGKNSGSNESSGDGDSKEDCPEPHEKECPPDGLHIFKHPYSCKHFFVCYDGEDILFSCAPGLLFDPKNLWCDIPDNVQCEPDDDSNGSGEGGIGPTPEPCPEPHEVECPSEEGFHTIKHPYTCDFYFICSEGQSVLLPCAPGLLFDKVNLWCDIEDNVDCHVNNNSTGIECPSEDGFYFIKHPDSCVKYYVCSGGYPVLQECAPGLLFDPVNEWCDFAENVTCFLDEGSPGPPAIDDPFPFQCTTEDGIHFHKDPTSCTNYFICSNGELIHMSCSDNLVYDPDNEWCDYPENVQCDIKKPHSLTLFAPNNINFICPINAQFEKFPHPTNLDQYLLCSDGNVATVNCAPGLTYNLNTKRCEQH